MRLARRGRISSTTKAKPEHWSPDGTHLTPAGHQLVADAWLEAVKI